MRSWESHLYSIKNPLTEGNVCCAKEDFVEEEKSSILHFSLAHRASHFPVCDPHERQCFSPAPRVYSGLRGGVSIRYYHQRDIPVLAGVRSTPFPSLCVLGPGS